MILKEKLTKRHNAWIAQLAEHVHGKDGVLGSNPSPGSRYKQRLFSKRSIIYTS